MRLCSVCILVLLGLSFLFLTVSVLLVLDAILFLLPRFTLVMSVSVIDGVVTYSSLGKDCHAKLSSGTELRQVLDLFHLSNRIDQRLQLGIFSLAGTINPSIKMAPCSWNKM